MSLPGEGGRLLSFNRAEGGTPRHPRELRFLRLEMKLFGSPGGCERTHAESE